MSILAGMFQARRQDSVTGGHKEFFGGHENFIYVNQTKKVKTKKKVFGLKISTNSGFYPKYCSIFQKF